MDEYSFEGMLTDDGRSVTFLHASMVKRLLHRWKGKPLEVTVRVLRRKRSDRQNRYMWGVIVPCITAFLMETTGIKHPPSTIYAWIRNTLLDEEPVITEVAGHEVIELRGKRFSEMTTKEFAEAVDTIREKMRERGCEIPEPTGNNLLTDFIKNVSDD
jgi:hypothetical protein